MTRWLLAAVLCLFTASICNADPIVLKEINELVHGASHVNAPGGSAMVFTLMYGPAGGTGGTKTLGIDAAVEVGGTVGGHLVSWASGSSGFVDFNSTNSSDFNALVARITNGQSELFYRGDFLLIPTVGSPQGIDLIGGWGGLHESILFQTSSDLAGLDITSIRLSVSDASITNTDLGDGTFGVVWNADVTWQFLGNIPSVPAPSTLLLLSTGLAGLAARRWSLRGFLQRKRQTGPLR
ncbi:MAG TPA: PEP-CTERM sorting domain-containing protein [Terriglobia bacterium]|nr:PEP-CTERM sorting domain-containing protein [Terriglobia bacterium]